jgi:penicillin-binding protein 1C
MPLPRRVDEVDVHATRVSPSAYTPPPRSVVRPQLNAPAVSAPVQQKEAKFQGVNFRQAFGCLLRMGLLGVLFLVILLILGGSYMLYEYYTIAATLPSVNDLRLRASTFETTRIYDRNGNVLYEIIDPNAGRRTYVSLDEISPYLVAATIATEDKSFYSHPGFDWLAIVRAFWQNTQSGETVSGASTITQQLARILLLGPEERYEQSYIRKVREALLAAEITRRYSKDEILELYLNEIFYGNLAYGIEAASETYFDTTARELTLSQASFLAGLPQAPAVYDVYNNREATRLRHQAVLTLMYQASQEQGCIFVSNSPQRVCVDSNTAVSAYVELENYNFKPPDVEMRYPHWVSYIRSLLEAQFDSQTIYRSGFSIYTTLDPALQDSAQQIVSRQVAALAANNANNGALVAIRPATGEILAMVGSADFYNEAIDGQVNMAISPTRQPGSSIKPFTYLAAFERGWTPATLIWDVPSEFPPSGNPSDPRPPYVPVNYDGRFHGPVTVRSALANSYNVPAVKTLQFVGVFDDPNAPGETGLVGMASRLGITSLTREDYGLSLTLGGGEVSLLEMTGAYAVLANSGRRVPPVAITRIQDHNGNVIFQYQAPAGEQVVRAEHAYLISSILSDNEARTPMFGANSVLALPFVAAAKTGTTNDFRDNWTLGYTPDLAVGVWVGNADYTPMQNTTGLTGAAPIWAEFMQLAVPQLTGGSPTQFTRPAGIVDRVICTVSGSEPSQWCPSQRSEIFAADQPPLPSSQDLWSRVNIDTWTGLRASEACPDFTREEFSLNVTDVWAIAWIQNDPAGRAWAEQYGFTQPILFTPGRECRADDSRPYLSFVFLSDGQTLTTSPVDIYVLAYATSDFQSFELDYGLSDNPVEWNRLFESNQPVNPAGLVYQWDVHQLPAGTITLRLTMRSVRNTSAERLIRVNIQVPTSTPTPTTTLTPTPTSTQTPMPTPTSPDFPTPTPTPPEIPSPTPTMSDQPTTTPTPEP